VDHVFWVPCATLKSPSDPRRRALAVGREAPGGWEQSLDVGGRCSGPSPRSFFRFLLRWNICWQRRERHWMANGEVYEADLPDRRVRKAAQVPRRQGNGDTYDIRAKTDSTDQRNQIWIEASQWGVNGSKNRGTSSVNVSWPISMWSGWQRRALGREFTRWQTRRRQKNFSRPVRQLSFTYQNSFIHSFKFIKKLVDMVISLRDLSRWQESRLRRTNSKRRFHVSETDVINMNKLQNHLIAKQVMKIYLCKPRGRGTFSEPRAACRTLAREKIFVRPRTTKDRIQKAEFVE